MGKDLIAPWCSGSMQISEQRALDCSKALTKGMRKKPCDGGSKTGGG